MGEIGLGFYRKNLTRLGECLTTRGYKGPTPFVEIDGTEGLGYWVGKIADGKTLPAMRRRNLEAELGDPIDLWYYQPIAAGRRCSCVGTGTPKGQCYVCWKTGKVGGYKKWGTEHWVLDATLPGLRLTDVTLQTTTNGPALLTLGEGRVRGYIHATGSTQGCWGPVDCLWSKHDEGEGSLQWWIRTPSQTTWQVLTTSSLTSLFSTPQRFEIKGCLLRPSETARSPKVGCLVIRIKRRPDATLLLRANRPRNERSMSLAEMGLLDEWSSARLWINAGHLPNLTSEDWCYSHFDGFKWKIISVDPLEPRGYKLSWDVSVMKVQPFDPLNRFPK